MNEDPKEAPKPPSIGSAKRLPYERPAVVSDEVFETLALSCANDRGVCSPGPGQS